MVVPGRQEVGGEARVVKCRCNYFMKILVENSFSMSITIILYSKQIFAIYLSTKMGLKNNVKPYHTETAIGLKDEKLLT